MFLVVWGEVGGVLSREPPSQDSLCFSECPRLAAALKQVQIPAGARHIQIELLEKAPHRIGECCVGEDRVDPREQVGPHRIR